MRSGIRYGRTSSSFARCTSPDPVGLAERHSFGPLSEPATAKISPMSQSTPRPAYSPPMKTPTSHSRVCLLTLTLVIGALAGCSSLPHWFTKEEWEALPEYEQARIKERIRIEKHRDAAGDRQHFEEVLREAETFRMRTGADFQRP